MKVIVTYIDFHWDNYQGGSGKSFILKFIYDAPGELRCADLTDRIQRALDDHVNSVRPFSQNNKYDIVQMEIIQ